MIVNKTMRRLRRILGISNIDMRGYSGASKHARPNDEIVDIVRDIRGRGRKPVIFIHGVMPRSGTVFTGEILRLHPSLHAYPNELWEIPFLELTGDLIDVQRHFLRAYRQNAEKMNGYEFLPLFGASMVAYLHSFVPEEKRVLVKIPDVQYLDYFPTVFPCEHLLLLMRDGRDVVNSTVKTWADADFAETCREWNLGARAILDFNRAHEGKRRGYWMVKYEDVVSDPAAFASLACKKFELDESSFPVERISSISVRGSSEIKNGGKVTWSAAEKPENFNPVGRWQGWSERDKRIFKKIAGGTLIEAGYCDNLDW